MWVGMVVQNCNLSSRRAEAGGCKFEASLGYLVSEFRRAGGT